MIRRYVALAAVVVLALAATACGKASTTIVQTSASNTGIQASGIGKAVGTPDVALIQIGTDVERPTVDAARQTAADAQTAIIASLKANGVDDQDIQTVQFSISPQYNFNNGTQTLRAYRVSNVVSTKVRKIDTAGKVIDDATKAGGDSTTVRNISFTIDDPTKLQEQARQAAVKQAQDRAQQLASNAGSKLGKLLSVTEGAPTSPPVPQAAALVAPRTGDASTPIQTGELEISITVNVVYAIE